MTPLLAIMLGTMTAAALTAVLLARRRVEHRPAAVALVLLAALNFAQVKIGAALSPYPVEPWQGWSRVLVYLDGAVVLGAAVVTPGLALAVTAAPRPPRVAVAIVAGVWFLASVVLAALYPSPLVRGAALARLYLAADLIGLFVAIVALARWARWARGRASPGSAQMVALALVGLDLGILLVPHSPWRESAWVSPLGRFDIIQIGIVVFFATFTAAQGIAWNFSAR